MHAEWDDLHCPFSPIGLDGEELGPDAKAAAAQNHAQHAPHDHNGFQPVPTQQAISMPSGVNDIMSSLPLASESQVAHQSIQEGMAMSASMPTPLPCNPQPMAVDANADWVEDAV